MGTLFAGIIRAPMTSVFMIFEITQDYQILVPLMVANLLSFLISRRYQPTPVYHALLEQDHIHLPSAVLKPAPGALLARDVMSRELPLVAPECSVESVWITDPPGGATAYLVGAANELSGVVSRSALAGLIESGRGKELVGALCTPDVVHAHGDQPIDVLMERFAESPGVLPVLSREHARRIDGVITIAEITGFLQRRQAARRTATPPE